MYEDTILRLPQVQAWTGLSRSTIYSRVQEGLLPPPFAIGKRARGWSASEISSVNRALISGAAEAEIKRLIFELVEKRGYDLRKNEEK